MRAFLAKDVFGKQKMICAECIKDEPPSAPGEPPEYRYADWYVGEPVPYEGTYEDAVGNLDGRTPTCDSCCEEFEPDLQTVEADWWKTNDSVIDALEEERL